MSEREIANASERERARGLRLAGKTRGERRGEAVASVVEERGCNGGVVVAWCGGGATVREKRERGSASGG